ncbi:fibroblast growth factor receptor 1-like [Dendronephthya gigantea]|uniref:fibroblast growth factor receptor 1-like n=1 Tax=Dendronephthya gigantea TaxID=151771 RepID=UPI0010693D5D|nr:fibroblast growth factor receptor 1-like [Dendronephthya gigantea]
MSMPLIAGGSTGAFVFLCLAVFIFLFLLRKIQKKRRDRSIQEFESRWFEINLQKTNAAIERPNRSSESRQKKISYVALLKRWQISPNRLKVLNKPLGVGQFGIVKKGLYSPQSGGDPKDVAVKMLKDNATQSALSNLLAELKILKKINKEPHPNVIRFIGGLFTEDQLMVVTEYCSSGNLLKFLRRSKVIDTESNASHSESDKLNSTLSSCQLLKIAVEVSSGMLYLSKQKLVHRDLAARNILLGGEGNVAKISDFGLARDIRNTQAYIRTNQDLLPVKWMALESLTEDRFTTASDV